MIPKKGVIPASVIVGIFGALVGGLWGSVAGAPIDGFGTLEVTRPVSIIAGFLVCFGVSVWYLRFTIEKPWHSGYGPLFAALAGVICGVITGIGQFVASIIKMPEMQGPLANLIFIIVLGVFLGGITGLIIGGVFSLLFALFFARFFDSGEKHKESK